MTSDLMIADDAPEYGPAMQALSPLMRRFVLAVLDQRKRNNAAAARKAGYADPGGDNATVRVTGHRLAHDPRVIAALHEEAGKRLETAAHIAASVVVDVMTDKDATHKDKLKAAGMLLDRTGFGAAQTINVNKTTTDRTGKAIMERIAALSQKLGVDASRLLGPASPAVVDVEFSEVKDG